MKTLFALIFCLLQTIVFSQSYEDSIREIRVKHFAHLTNPESNVLKQEEIDHFEGLDYFLIDTNWILTTRYQRKRGPKFEMPMTTERKPVYRRTGFVYFTVNAVEYKLTVYRNIQLSKEMEYKDHLFVPFRDLTSGKDSYGGGRYLDLTAPKGKELTIDFNLCYNPYCAYSDRFSCPIPPDENTLDLEVKAGEKTPIGL
jgi:uncharacterized protein (DUF1684 family)